MTSFLDSSLLCLLFKEKVFCFHQKMKRVTVKCLNKTCKWMTVFFGSQSYAWICLSCNRVILIMVMCFSLNFWFCHQKKVSLAFHDNKLVDDNFLFLSMTWTLMIMSWMIRATFLLQTTCFSLKNTVIITLIFLSVSNPVCEYYSTLLYSQFLFQTNHFVEGNKEMTVKNKLWRKSSEWWFMEVIMSLWRSVWKNSMVYEDDVE